MNSSTYKDVNTLAGELIENNICMYLEEVHLTRLNQLIIDQNEKFFNELDLVLLINK